MNPSHPSANALLDQLLDFFKQGKSREECVQSWEGQITNTTFLNDFVDPAHAAIFAKLLDITFDLAVHTSDDSTTYTLTPHNNLSNPPLHSSSPRVPLHKHIELKG